MNLDIDYLNEHHLIGRVPVEKMPPLSRFCMTFGACMHEFVRPIALTITGGACMVNATVRGVDQYVHEDGFHHHEAIRDARGRQLRPRPEDLIGPALLDPRRNGGVGWGPLNGWQMISDHIVGHTLVISTWLPEDAGVSDVVVSLYGDRLDARKVGFPTG